MIDTAASPRTLANAVIVEGFFALAWFSWAQARPLGGAAIVLEIGAILSVLVAGGGIVAARGARHESPPPSGRRFGLVVATELAAIAAGAAILSATGRADYIAAWVCLVVGVHFVPLDPLFPGLGMIPLAAAVGGVAVAAFVVGATTSVPPGTVAGLGAGACLLGHSAWLLATAARHRAAR